MDGANAARKEGKKVVSVLDFDDVPSILPKGSTAVELKLREKAEMINNHVERGNDVYVHCMRGRNRSVACVAAYLVMFKRLDSNEAWDAIQDLRPVANVKDKNTFSREIENIQKSIKQAQSEGTVVYNS